MKKRTKEQTHDEEEKIIESLHLILPPGTTLLAAAAEPQD